ncbi:MAG: TonB-dependent receptor [Gammaproteobacteria bacterium]
MASFDRMPGTLYGVLLSVALASAEAAPAFAEEPHQFDITTHEAVGAINAFGSQSGVQILASATQLKDKSLNEVRGRLSTDAGLRILLANTGLTYRYVGDHTVAIVRADTEEDGDPARKAPDGTAPAPKPAPADPTPPHTASGSAPRAELTIVPMPEILVKGSKSINADIERTRDDVQPYVVFSAEDLRQSNARNLNDFFKTRLPMNTVSTTNAQLPNNLTGNQSAINLRGLGPNQTLVLIDGRRMPSINFAGNMTQPDISAIPLGAIERIEVLPSTASGIFGGGATGGAINIITRKDYTGVDLGVSHGSSFHGDAGNSRVDGSAGFELPGTHTHVLVSGSHAENDSLYNDDRDILARARARQLRNNPAAFYTLATPPLGYTTNIRSQNGSNLVLKTGTALGAPRTYVPMGYAGVGTDQGAALVANAGQYILALPDTVLGGRQNLLNGTTTDAASVNLRQDLGERFQALADVSWLDDRSRALSATGPSSVTLPVSAPNNPFTTPITVSFPATGLAFPLHSEQEALRVLGGFIAHLPHEWLAETDYVWSRSRFTGTQTNPATGDPDGTGPGIADTTALASGVLDVMRDLNARPIDWSPYELPSPNLFYGPADTTLRDASLRTSGPALTLPGGALTLTGLVEWRREQNGDAWLQSMGSSGTRSVSVYPGAAQTVRSYYAEARAPLVSAQNASRFASELQLQASVRHDDYETTAPSPSSVSLDSPASPVPAVASTTNRVGATKFTVAASYSPIEMLMLRASLGTGFLAPSITQISPGQPFDSSVTLIDPKRGGVSATYPVHLVSGGSSGLLPEDSRSWSVGAVLSPRQVPDLRVSLDYTHIEKTNEIGSISQQAWVDNEDTFPGRVTRAPLTPADTSLGYAGGVITGLDLSFVNFAHTRLDAYDLQADYTWHTQGIGDFHFNAVATWEPEFSRKSLLSGPYVDSAGFNSGPLEWRGNAGVAWMRGPWSILWNVQYFDDYFAYAAGSSIATVAAVTLNQGAGKVSSQIYHDLTATYRFDSPWTKGLDVSRGHPEPLRPAAADSRDHWRDGWL